MYYISYSVKTFSISCSLDFILKEDNLNINSYEDILDLKRKCIENLNNRASSYRIKEDPSEIILASVIKLNNKGV